MFSNISKTFEYQNENLYFILLPHCLIYFAKVNTKCIIHSSVVGEGGKDSSVVGEWYTGRDVEKGW